MLDQYETPDSVTTVDAIDLVSLFSTDIDGCPMTTFELLEDDGETPFESDFISF